MSVDKYVEFLEQLNAGRFPTHNSAIRSISRRSISRRQKALLMEEAEKYFGVQAKPSPPVPSNFEKFIQASGGPKDLSGVPAASSAYLSFLREAIKTNVDVAMALKAIKDIGAEVDVTEAQGLVNRLAIFIEHYDEEVFRVLSIVDSEPSSPPATETPA